MDPVEELRMVKEERDAQRLVLTAIVEAIGGAEEVSNEQLMNAFSKRLMVERLEEQHSVRVWVE